MNDDSRGTYSTNSQIKLKTLMLRSILCDYSDAYILAKGTIIIVSNKLPQIVETKKIIKNCAPFTDCRSENRQYRNRSCKRH